MSKFTNSYSGIFIILSILLGMTSISLNSRLNNLEEQNEILEGNLDDTKDEYNNLEKEFTKLKLLKLEVESYNDDLEGIIDKNKKEIKSLKDKNVKLKNTNNELKTSNVSRSSNISESRNSTPKPKSNNTGKLIGTFEATAYTDNVQSQGKWVGQTASGMKPQVGVIAVDPSIIPLGTKLYVEGYGNCVAGDTGGAIKGNRIDLFKNTQSECTSWGRRSVKVYRR